MSGGKWVLLLILLIVIAVIVWMLMSRRGDTSVSDASGSSGASGASGGAYGRGDAAAVDDRTSAPEGAASAGTDDALGDGAPSQPVRFAGGASDDGSAPEDAHSTEAEIIESEAARETTGAPAAEADWSESPSPEATTESAVDSRDGSDAVASAEAVDHEPAPSDAVGGAQPADAGAAPPADVPVLGGPTTSVMGARDAGDLAAAQEPVAETGSRGAGSSEPDVAARHDDSVAAAANVADVGDASSTDSRSPQSLSGGAAPLVAGAGVAAGTGAGAAASTTSSSSAPAKPAQVREGKFGKGSADPADDGSGPQGWTIKGNEDSNLFHTQDSPSYGRTKAEIWFDTEDSARGAGFVRWDEKDRSRGGAQGAAALVDIPEGKFGAGSADPAADGSGPQGWAIKGNEDSMLFHTQDSPAYGRTKAEVWFQDEEAARRAGFTKWNERHR